jgi:hypothetical protein
LLSVIDFLFIRDAAVDLFGRRHKTVVAVKIGGDLVLAAWDVFADDAVVAANAAKLDRLIQ